MSRESPSTCSQQVSASSKIKNKKKSAKNAAEKTYKCPYYCCKFKCTQLRYLKEHMKRHALEGPYLCNHCGWKGKFSYQLSQHIQVCHPKILLQKFKCRFCIYSTTEVASFNRHICAQHQRYQLDEAVYAESLQSSKKSILMEKHLTFSLHSTSPETKTQKSQSEKHSLNEIRQHNIPHTIMDQTTSAPIQLPSPKSPSLPPLMDHFYSNSEHVKPERENETQNMNMEKDMDINSDHLTESCTDIPIIDLVNDNDSEEENNSITGIESHTNVFKNPAPKEGSYGKNNLELLNNFVQKYSQNNDDEMQLKIESEEVEEEIKPFGCAYCSEEFGKAKDLKIHLESHPKLQGNGKLKYSRFANFNRLDPEGSFNLQEREHHHHPLENSKSSKVSVEKCTPVQQSIKGKTSSIRCKFCDYFAGEITDLENHLKIHSLYQCSACNYSTAFNGNLKMHVDSKHKRESHYNVGEEISNRESVVRKHNNTVAVANNYMPQYAAQMAIPKQYRRASHSPDSTSVHQSLLVTPASNGLSTFYSVPNYPNNGTYPARIFGNCFHNRFQQQYQPNIRFRYPFVPYPGIARSYAMHPTSHWANWQRYVKHMRPIGFSIAPEARASLMKKLTPYDPQYQ